MRGCGTWKEEQPGSEICHRLGGGHPRCWPTHVLAPALLESSGVHTLPQGLLFDILKIITKGTADRPSATETGLPHYRV